MVEIKRYESTIRIRYLYLYPRKMFRGYYGSCMLFVHACVRRDFLVFNLQATFLKGFFFKFATCIDMLEISPPYCFGSLGVNIESEMSQIRVKFANIIPFACVQPTGHIFAGISFRFCRNITMGEVLPPYCFGSLKVKIESESYSLWGLHSWIP